MLIRPGDEIVVREGSRKRSYFKSLGKLAEARTIPRWIERDTEKLSGKVILMPERQDIDASINEQLIIEYYSR